MPSAVRKIRPMEIEYGGDIALDRYMDQVEAKIIRDTLLDSGGNITKAAEKLQIKRQTLQHKLKKYKLTT